MPLPIDRCRFQPRAPHWSGWTRRPLSSCPLMKIIPWWCTLFLPCLLHAQPLTFPLDQQGFVRHWLFSGAVLSEYQGNAVKPEEIFRELRSLPAPFPPPRADRSWNSILPNGATLRPFAMGQKIFLDAYQFHRKLVVVEGYALTELVAPKSFRVRARLWTGRGAVEMWLNGRSVAQEANSKSAPSFSELELELQEGRNRIFIRRMVLGERNQVFETGLQFPSPSNDLRVGLPGNEADLANFFGAERWLMGVRGDSNRELSAEAPPPATTSVIAGHDTVTWPKGKRRFSLQDVFGAPAPPEIRIEIKPGESVLTRSMDWPSSMPLQRTTETSIATHRRSLLATLSEDPERISPHFFGFRIMAQLQRGMSPENERVQDNLSAMIRAITNRDGNSDFQLMAALRWWKQCADRFAPNKRELFRSALLEFRYWNDETGLDTLVFSSENHQILLHSSQRIAGLLFPEAPFSRSKRSGAEQAAIGKIRLEAWMTDREKWGFQEFLAPAYIGETIMGLLNVYDYGDDAVLRGRAGKLIDHLYKISALYSFQGYGLGPAGRLYRDELLMPQREAKQGMLSWATPRAVLGPNAVLMALSTSTYEPPIEVERWMGEPVEQVHLEGETELYLKKAADYMISSCRIPVPQKTNYARPDDILYGMRPGKSLYQYHLWEATIGDAARVFVQHPGTTEELVDARPGYWVGEGSAPTLQGANGRVHAIYRLSPTLPVQFTHAWWPQMQFDEQSIEKNWAFGRRGAGYVALWCSQALVAFDNVSTRSELRAWGSEMGWVCWTSSTSESGTFEEFRKKAKALSPAYDAASGALLVTGKEVIRWVER